MMMIEDSNTAVVRCKMVYPINNEDAFIFLYVVSLLLYANYYCMYVNNNKGRRRVVVSPIYSQIVKKM